MSESGPILGKGPPMLLNWAYTNNGGKHIHHRLCSSHYILKLPALASGAQRGLFQMVYLILNIHRLYLANPHKYYFHHKLVGTRASQILKNTLKKIT